MPTQSGDRRGVEAMRALMMLSLAILVLTPAPTEAKDDGKPAFKKGTWQFRHKTKPVKVVLLGGSIGATPGEHFRHYLGAACSKVEIRNISKTGYGAWHLKQHFRAQFLENWHVRPSMRDAKLEFWLIYSGGLNSIYSPESTIKQTRDIFVLAHRAKMKVVALSLTPWGSEADKRWRGFGGLDYRTKTQRVVDFVLGRLARNAAMGRHTGKAKADQTTWDAGELPDVAVDLYDSPLRNADAALRARETLEKRYNRRKSLKARWPNAEKAITGAMAVPKWFLRPELKGFDHIHPNGAGHKIMAEQACPKLPQSWGCECAQIKQLGWRKGKVVGVPKTP